MPRKNKTIPHKYTPFAVVNCTSKRRFTSEKAALQQAELRMLEQPRLNLSVYHCQHCRGWHLTSRPPA